MLGRWMLITLAVIVLSGCASVCNNRVDATFVIINYKYDEAPEKVSIIINNEEHILIDIDTFLWTYENEPRLTIGIDNHRY